MATPVIAQGSKVGMHAIRPGQVIPLVRQAHARGALWPLVKAVDNGGVAIDVKAIEPRTLTIVRFVNDQEDAAQNVDQWTTADMHAHAGRALDSVWRRLNAQERAAADWIEPINEACPNDPNPVGWDPKLGRKPYPAGWRAFGEYMKILVEEGNQRGMKLALPAFNAGTPEWAEAQAMVDTGVFEAMKAGGHILTVHEGTFSGDAVDKGFGELIRDAPAVPGAGNLCFRYRYLYSLLAARDQVVPLVVSEFYAGGSYQLPPAEQVRRFAWYDQQARQDPYVLAVLPFTIDPSPGWAGSDYTPAYPAVLDYLVAEKDKPNATAIAPTVTSVPNPVPASGGNQPDVSTALPGTHRVTALKLNVREFPWVGSAEPPMAGASPLVRGAVITVLGVYKPADHPIGWGCISPDGNQWVSMQWVEALPSA